MVWNVEFQLAGLIITVIIATMCWGQHRLNFAAERSFSKLLAAVMFCTLCDISSVVAINYQEVLGPVLTEIFCEVYLFTILLVAYTSAWFGLAEISYTIKNVWKYITMVPLGIQLIALVVLHTKIYFDPLSGALYTYGTTVILTYALCVVYLVTILTLIIVLRKQINKRRRYSMYFWLVAWLGTALIQLSNNQLLLVSFAMSIACMYMFIRLENPEYHLDFSTNVFNRKGFSILLEEKIRFKRKPGIVNFTINNMNQVNEIFGNKNLKELIKAICSFLLELPGSVVFRLEDDLFTICFDEVEDTEEIIRQLENRFSKTWEVNQVNVLINISISYMSNDVEFDDVDELEEIIHYFAQEARKEENTENIEINKESLLKREKAINSQHALEWAVAHDAVEMYYQPIYSIKDGRFNSMEALVRIRDSKGNLLMPNEFIEYAEKNGMILKLGEMIFRSVCSFMQRSHIEKYGIEYIEVNLSVVQCMQEDLARNFMSIMGEYGIPPHRINLEITETAAINSKHALSRNMDELVAYGTSFSLDDYGSGYSNLTYIVGMPLKIIKLDRELTISYAKSEKARIAIEYTVEMVHKLGMHIVVEGIETEEEYMAFKKLDVEYIQGYYFSKPLPKERVVNFIQEWL